MKFNSFEFLGLVTLTFILYWFILGKKKNSQNVLILVVSYVFYGFWDYRFLGLIFLSSLVDYIVGLQMPDKSRHVKKLLLITSLAVNIGMLVLFKYFNFFGDNLNLLLGNLFNYELNSLTLNLILPVGISFYTFQTLSYTIDVYNGKVNPTKNPIEFFAYVSFFPQLVAGPIERATTFLPQFKTARIFDFGRVSDGLKQALWGCFKKVVIADNLGTYVDHFFSNPQGYDGSELAIGVVYFAFQIYCDFSGYSDMAIGIAKVFGFNLMQNFNFPYLSRDIGEFWRRWHISLSTWFRDYVYIPMGGSKGQSKSRLFLNVMALFLISGLWHGANWTFITWGALNAMFFLPLIFSKTNRKNLDIVDEDRIFPRWGSLLRILGTFMIVNFCWVFFRAESMGHALEYLSRIFSPSFFTMPDQKLAGLPLILLLYIIEWFSRRKKHPLEDLSFSLPLRWATYLAIIFAIILFEGEGKTFIYFQF